MCIEMGCQLIDFMVDAIQGPCKENQKTFFAHKVSDFCKDFINDLEYQEAYFDDIFYGHEEQLIELIRKVIQLLTALLEANNNKELINSLSMQLNVNY